MQSGAVMSTLCLRRSTSNPRHCVRPWRIVCTSSKGASILKNFGRSKMRSRRLKVSASSPVGPLTTPGSWANTYFAQEPGVVRGPTGDDADTFNLLDLIFERPKFFKIDAPFELVQTILHGLTQC